MRKMSGQELHKLGWLFGLWDRQENQWDAISANEGDPGIWLEACDCSRYQAYDLSTGKQI